MSTRSVRRPQLIVLGALVLLVTLLPPSASAAPGGWTEPETIPGTFGVGSQVSATAPDGTDAVLWIVQTVDDQIAIRGRVRRPGTSDWVTVQAYVTDAAQNLVIAPDRHGDFWVTWERYNPNTLIPNVLVSRLDSDSATLTPPHQPFDAQDYGHQFPFVAVSDTGTVFIAATAQPKQPSSPPRYRAEVGVKRPGEPWSTRFLSPVDGFGITRSLAVSPNGHAVVAFTQGFTLAEKTVRAATRPAGAASTWTVDNVSVVGDGQNAKAAIGPDGMAAVSWNAPSDGTSIVRLAFRDVTTADDWISTNLVTEGVFNQMEQPVVDPDGYITGFWWNGRIWARQVQDGVVLDPNAASPADVRSDVSDVEMGNGGMAGLLYQSFDGNIDSLGLRFRWVDNGLALEEQVLTMAVDGPANTVRLGLDAADHVNVIWRAGTFPDTELRSMGNPPGSPSVVSAPHFGEVVTSATMTGRARVARVLTCDAGYVVEANEVRWRWYRNGNRITGATDRTYTVRGADDGKRIKCAMVAVGIEGSTTVTSHARVIG